MATNKKSKAKVVKTVRVKKVKEVKPTFSFHDRVEKLVHFSSLYNSLNRKFTVGSIVVLNNYSFFSEDASATYRMAIILETPKLFAKYKQYQIAYITPEGIVRTSDVEKSEIICTLEDAPIGFTFA